MVKFLVNIDLSNNSLNNQVNRWDTVSFWHNSAHQTLASLGAGNTNGTVNIWPMNLENFATATMARIHLSVSSSSATSGALSLQLGLYSLVNSTQITLVSSGSQSYSWTSGTNAASNWGGYGSARGWTVPMNVSATPGIYFGAMLVKTTVAGTYSVMCGSDGAGYGADIGVLSAGSHQLIPFQGSYSAASVSLPGSMARSDIVGASGSATSRSPRFMLLTAI